MKREMAVSNLCEFCLIVLPFINQGFFAYIKTLISSCNDTMFSTVCSVFLCAYLFYKKKKHEE